MGFCNIADVMVNDFRELADLLLSHGYLPIVVIYCSPKDFPDKYVARLWKFKSGNSEPTEYMALSDTLEDLYKLKLPGMFCINRHETDDPCIVETWL